MYKIATNNYLLVELCEFLQISKENATNNYLLVELCEFLQISKENPYLCKKRKKNNYG